MGRFSSDVETRAPILDDSFVSDEEVAEERSPPTDFRDREPWSKKTKKNQVFLEGYVETGDEENHDKGGSNGFSRTKSLTDDDLDELKGCLDLGFGFSYDEIPELCNTLPALELCYSMSQRFLDEQQKSPETSVVSSATPETCSSSSGPIANWRISSPGDDPDEVKARLKFWAQAVACTEFAGGVHSEEVGNDDGVWVDGGGDGGDETEKRSDLKNRSM
ncbi:hypothetical protein NE237_013325 [Protea cynaroides]|uniref:Uncharacterized protein n=1 Tax=Protea cynaroides TaxID=273540 RepID=A0A9Q0GYE8_9MAGN|nr:hypothetical protein NE237_013325 [Protea cynaroides]